MFMCVYVCAYVIIMTIVLDDGFSLVIENVKYLLIFYRIERTLIVFKYSFCRSKAIPTTDVNAKSTI